MNNKFKIGMSRAQTDLHERLKTRECCGLVLLDHDGNLWVVHEYRSSDIVVLNGADDTISDESVEMTLLSCAMHYYIPSERRYKEAAESADSEAIHAYCSKNDPYESSANHSSVDKQIQHAIGILRMAIKGLDNIDATPEKSKSDVFLGTLRANVDNENLSDAGFRSFVRNSMSIIQQTNRRYCMSSKDEHTKWTIAEYSQ